MFFQIIEVEDDEEDSEQFLGSLSYEFAAVYYCFQRKIAFFKPIESFCLAMGYHHWDHKNYSFNNLILSRSTRVIFVRPSAITLTSNQERETYYISLISILLTEEKSIMKAPNRDNLRKVS